jgi:hypothetical protein
MIMNKLFTFVAFTLSTATFCSHAQNQNPFAQLTPKIEELADQWVTTSVAPFSYNRNQKLMNLLSSQNITSQDIADTIAAEPSISQALEEIGTSINFCVESYITNIQKKWANKQLNDEEEKEFFAQLQQKVMELINYTSTIYYAKLDAHMQKHKA